MIIERSQFISSPLTNAPAPSTPVLARPQEGGPLRSYYAAALLDTQLLLCGTPAQANPLDAVPTSWFPSGQHNRPYGAYLGPVAIPRTSGTASVHRGDEELSLTSPHGNFRMARDPQNPGRVLVDTPQGQYSGTLRTGRHGEVIFDDGQGRTVTLKRVPRGLTHSEYIEINASGFGLPAGHLRVFR